jgi:hypothetical protein
MDLIVERVHVWAAGIPNEPGGLSRVLKGLREAGADLNFVVARRSFEDSSDGVVFLTPIRGDRETEAASLLGFNLADSVESVRVEGKNTPGAAARVAGLIADAAINVRGFSAAVIGSRFTVYVGFDSPQDADLAIEILKKAGTDIQSGPMVLN